MAPCEPDGGAQESLGARANLSTMSLLLVAVTILLAVGCSTTRYRESADREVYGIIQEKTPMAPNMDAEFTIEQDELPDLSECPTITDPDPALGDAADSEVGAHVISLERALAIAVRHNRGYQARKESLYLSALSLTLDRHRYTPIFSGGVSGSYDGTTRDVARLSTTGAIAQAAPELVRDLGALTGTPADLLSRYATIVNEAATLTELNQPSVEVIDENSVSGRTSFGMGLLLKGGGQIAIDLTSNFLRYITGDPRESATSALTGSITQPLLRGAGSKVAAERLTQAERDVLYDLRSFTRYRKEFTVQIASQYYGVLQARDAVTNNYQSYLAFQRSAERDRAMVAEGKRKRSDLGRVQQAELNAQNGWSNSVRNYRRQMDEFKIQLGLPVDAPITLDQGELQTLHEAGLREWTIDPDDAVEVALVSRLDLYNVRDQVDDAGRQVEVASNALLPQLDVILFGAVDSRDENRFQEFDFERARWSLGADLDLALDRKAERNSFRSALIAFERSRRDLDQAIDEVKLDVREAWRALDQARITYEVRRLGVEINSDRVEEQALLAELGQGDALNLVDAQNDLTSAQNDLTSALVQHTIARLAFWRDMGILYIKKNGQWEEVTDDVEYAAPAS